MNFHHLFAVYWRARFIGEARDDLPSGDVDHIASGGVGVFAVEAERNPARLLADFDARDLPRGHGRRVEDVHPAVVRVAYPQFPFIGSQSNPVARTAVPLHWTGTESSNLDAVQLAPRHQIPDF